MPDLTLPDQALQLADRVARAYAGHEQHTRNQAAAELRARADRLRSTPAVEDPLTSAFMARCHSQGGLVHSLPSHVAAVAYEAVADLLDPTRSNDEEEESRGN